MSLLGLPTELLRQIVRQYYEPWLLQLSSQAILIKDVYWLPTLSNYPSQALLSTCHILSELAKQEETASFTGVLKIAECSRETRMHLPIIRFFEALRGRPRYKWLQDNIRVIKLSNIGINPALWRVPHNAVPILELPNLHRIEVDCRYQSHFAIHNVQSAASFFDGSDGRLRKQMDYRHSFFLTCEGFLLHAVQKGIAITIIREMGVREMDDRCQASVVAINYVANEAGGLVLDWSSLKWSSAPIIGWPQNIRQTLASLQLCEP